MNKFNLFLIMSIGAVFATASIFGSTMTTAFAQGNDTGEVQVGSPLVFTAENATLAGNNATNATTAAAAGDSVVGQTPQVDATQNQATSDGADQTSDGETSDGETSDGETSGSGNDDSDSGNDDSDSGNDDSDSGNEDDK
jgi:hypothetical protein